MSETYTCFMCKETFEKVRSDEEAVAESKKLWGELPEEELEVVCDSCFKGMIKTIEQSREERLREYCEKHDLDYVLMEMVLRISGEQLARELIY